MKRDRRSVRWVDVIKADSQALFRKKLDGAESIVLSTHLNPDGDAIGSEVSLARFLLSVGKRVRIVNDDPPPPVLQYLLDGSIEIELFDEQRTPEALDQADLVILVDNSVPDRLGRMEGPLLAVADRVLCIDHHPSRDAPWVDNIVDVEASATTAMIYELVRSQGWTPDRQAAEALFVGLATDTGFFRFKSTNAQSYEIAAHLVRLGVEPARTYRTVYERNSEAFTRLLGHALVELKMEAGGTVASVRVPRTLIKSLAAEDEDTSEITTALLAMDGVQVALLFRELADGRVKVSLRSKGELDVHQLASEFGGGGHRNASGIVLTQSMEQAVAVVTERARSLLAASSRDSVG